jgi:hypothetical protein
VDCTCRTLCHTFLAKLALCKVDVSEIVLHSDGLERTDLGTLTAANAGSFAGLASHSTLVLVHAGYEYSHISASLVTELDDSLRTSFHTSAAGSTFFFIHYRESGGRIHRDCAKLTGSHAVATSKTTERTAGITAVKSSLDAARLISAVLVGTRTVLTGSVATHYCDLRFLYSDLNAKHGSDLLHSIVTTYRAEALVQVR